MILRNAIFLALQIFLVSAAFPAQAGKAPIPSAVDQKRAEKTVKDILGKDYSATDRAGKIGLAMRLLKEAASTKEVPEAFVLLRDAIDIAAAQLDFGTMSRAIDRMDERFEVSLEEIRSSAIALAKKAIASPEEAVSVADACLLFWERGMSVEAFDSALRWAKEAETIAKSSKDSAIIQTVKDMALEAGEARRDKTRADSARTALEKLQGDDTANYDLGSYLCFVRGQWEVGIQHLAKGPPGVIRDLAMKELALTKEPESQAEAALAWKAAAEKEKSSILKKRLFLRSRYWQEEALKGATGIARRKIERRLLPAIVVQKAGLTVGKTPVDVTKAVQDLLDSNPSSPLVVDHYTGGPFPGEERKLTIEYLIGKLPGKEVAGHWEAVVIPGVSPRGSIHPQASHAFSIVSAHYGAGFVLTDVTEKARRALLDGYTMVAADFAAIDPNPGQTKTLAVVFDCHGRRFIRWMKQGESGTLMK